MSGSSADSKPNLGLANCLSNVFKLAEVEGLKWIRYVGPNSTTLEAPKSDPVLTSYAKLVSDGYACSWRRLSPSTDGMSGEGKDLWIFYFTSLPDLSGKLASELKEDGTGSWEEGMSTDSSTMLFRALNSLIERSLLNENFLPLGKWFARPDPSMGSDGRGCFLCSFSFFIHAHLYICASVDVRAGPALQPLLPSHLHQALASSSGMQVILSPSGLNAIMTGHSYRDTDPGIEDLLEEWKLFYPARFELASTSPQLPAAVEVVLCGVRLRYPAQFVFVYHGEDSLPTPPPSPVEDETVDKIMQGSWEDTNCVTPLTQQKQCEECHCSQTLEAHHPSSRPRPYRLLEKAESLKGDRLSSKHSRFKPYSTHPTDNATPMKEHPTPSSLNLNPPVINKRKRPPAPKYTTPLPSPAVTLPSSAVPVSSHFIFSITPSTPPAHAPLLSGGHQSNLLHSQPLQVHQPHPQQQQQQQQLVSQQLTPPDQHNSYDITRVSELVAASSMELVGPSSSYHSSNEGWWQCLHLPESTVYRTLVSESRTPRLSVPPSPLMGSNMLASLQGTGSNRQRSPSARAHSRSSISSDMERTPISSSPKRRPSSGCRGGRSAPRGGNGSRRRPSETATRPEESYDISVYGSPRGQEDMLVEGLQTNGLPTQDATGGSVTSSAGGGGLSSKFGSMKTQPPLDFISASAVKISSSLERIFDSEEEEDERSAVGAFQFPDPSHTDLRSTSTTSRTTMLMGGDTHHLPLDFSRIYPTPPSVESTDDKYEEGKGLGSSIGGTLADERGEKMEGILISKMSPFDDVTSAIVPDEFQPLTCLSSLGGQNLPKHYVYTKPPLSAPITFQEKPSSSQVSGSSKSSSKVEPPQKFIFPPPSSLVSRPSSLGPLQLGSLGDGTGSPLISTPFNGLSSLTYSPMRVPGRLGRHLPSSAQTPLESPFDPITPTPLSSARLGLFPVLPEAHALYISLALLDSALSANVSDNVSIDISTIQNIMLRRSSWRTKLDSIGSASGVMGGGRSASHTEEPNSVLKIEEEKPLMMVGIADYPSLGFKEDLMSSPSSALDSSSIWHSMFGSITALSDIEDQAGVIPVKTFLALVQDHCLHMCLTGMQEAVPSSWDARALERQHLQASKDTCRLYHTHSVSSAILCGKQLVASPRFARGSSVSSMLGSQGLMKQNSMSVSLDKEDNSAAWIIDLLSLPTRFVTKKLRELKSVFLSSFHHAPCIKFSTKGPLSLRDLQSLTPSQTPIGDECVPLPMQPIVVGYDHEWMSVSPLTLPTWDKLLLEPYSSQKNVFYLVVSPGMEFMQDTIKNFFSQLSIIYKSCKLGSHLPMDKGIGEGGIITGSPESADDSKPATSTESVVGRICKEVLGPFLSKLPTDHYSLIKWNSAQPDPTFSYCGAGTLAPTAHHLPVSVVIYMVTRSYGTGDSTGCYSVKSEEVLKTLQLFSEMMAMDIIPEDTKSRVTLQLLDESELIGPNANSVHHLRSIAFSVFFRCRPVLNPSKNAQALTGFGPVVERPDPKCVVKLYAPLYILSPEPPLAQNFFNPATQQQQSSILFGSNELTLFCSYCVSSDQRWLLAVFCDRQAELLDSCIIGIHPSQMDGTGAGRFQVLQKLWMQCMTVVAHTVHQWNLVITRLGKPSSAEMKDWLAVVRDDGLMTANQLLKQDCCACSQTSASPKLINVIILSMQPERNIQLFPTIDPGPSISHILVLPPHPSSIPAMTPNHADNVPSIFDLPLPGATEGGDMLGGFVDDDIFNDIDKQFKTLEFDIFPNSGMGVAPGSEGVRAPLATGYLISTTHPGHLPDEFWGHDRPQTVCNMFKTHLHCHLSENALLRSPPEVLCSVLLSFDALSWMSMNHSTQRRNSSLPIHIFLLAKLYNFFSILSQPKPPRNNNSNSNLK